MSKGRIKIPVERMRVVKGKLQNIYLLSVVPTKMLAIVMGSIISMMLATAPVNRFIYLSYLYTVGHKGLLVSEPANYPRSLNFGGATWSITFFNLFGTLPAEKVDHIPPDILLHSRDDPDFP